ncbi:hypothetical protein PAXRUDRAFT_13455 [Paxillus rubicundulus Ve08.2h10]|uniref:Uncharacterized protein n=1 Tax=Paxillus rubicundulus Ve08.2h10 TaxID=930991 RepID=A0A0D0DTQ6_9AGAM|nr:hypothetical protein PAXRUDRAFT_13455 [Paxillus rubicundulus Ve08.2h10]
MGLKHLTKVDVITEPGQDITNALLENLEYLDTLKGDVISSARQLVTACRASGQCHEDVSRIINNGYTTGHWTKEELQDVALLRDVITRWSSISLMVDRLLELYPALSRLLSQDKYQELRKYELSEVELQVLADIRHYLAFSMLFKKKSQCKKL